MKKIIVSIALLAAVSFGSRTATAVVVPGTSSATATANAKLFHPIKLTWKQALEFGSLIAGPTNGYATINTTGMGALTVVNDNPYPLTPTMTGGAWRIEQPSDVVERPATFKAEGEPFWTFGIYLPTDPVHAAIVLAPGVNPNGIDDDPILELDEFNTNQPGSYVPVPNDVDGSGSPGGPGVPSPNGGIGTFNSIGVRYFAVGARVKIEPNDQPAQYTGEFTVTIYYN